MKLNHINNAQSAHAYYKWYDDNMKELYGPCMDSMKHILLHDRHDLFLGEWNTWDYKYEDRQ